MSDTDLRVIQKNPHNRRWNWQEAATAGGWWVARSVADNVLPAHGIAESVVVAARAWGKRRGLRVETQTLRGGREVRVRFSQVAS